MRIMCESFLRAKAWQLFGIAGILVVSVSISSTVSEGPIRATLGRLAVTSLCLGLLASFFLGWLWSVGALLNSVVLPRFRHNRKWFSFAAVVLVVIFVLIPWVLNGYRNLAVLWAMNILGTLSALCAYLEH